jgi:hypothetical protein
MYTKELRNIGGRKSQRVIIPHIFTKETYLLSPSTAVNTIHPKKEQSHEINLALLTYMVGTLPSLGQQGSRDFVSQLIWSPNGWDDLQTVRHTTEHDFS